MRLSTYLSIKVRFGTGVSAQFAVVIHAKSTANVDQLIKTEYRIMYISYHAKASKGQSPMN
jgi:hypothetical protein